SDDNLTSWNPDLDDNVRDILLDGSTLYLGGDFTDTGGTTRNRVAAYDLSGGTPSVPTASNANVGGGHVDALGLRSGVLYMGGNFATIGGTSRTSAGGASTSDSSVDSWDPQLNNIINDINLDDNILYVSGSNSIGPDLFSGFDLTGDDPNTA